MRIFNGSLSLRIILVTLLRLRLQDRLDAATGTATFASSIFAFGYSLQNLQSDLMPINPLTPDLFLVEDPDTGQSYRINPLAIQKEEYQNHWMLVNDSNWNSYKIRVKDVSEVLESKLPANHWLLVDSRGVSKRVSTQTWLDYFPAGAGTGWDPTTNPSTINGPEITYSNNNRRITHASGYDVNVSRGVHTKPIPIGSNKTVYFECVLSPDATAYAGAL